jgi:hypothetical protein
MDMTFDQLQQKDQDDIRKAAEKKQEDSLLQTIDNSDSPLEKRDENGIISDINNEASPESLEYLS